MTAVFWLNFWESPISFFFASDTTPAARFFLFCRWHFRAKCRWFSFSDLSLAVLFLLKIFTACLYFFAVSLVYFVAGTIWFLSLGLCDKISLACRWQKKNPDTRRCPFFPLRKNNPFLCETSFTFFLSFVSQNLPPPPPPPKLKA